MSAPFVARRGQTFTVSLWARGERNGEIHVQMPPSAREEGQRAKRLWCREGTKVAPVTNEWRRLSFTWPADVPPSGFWPEPHYMVLIGANDSTPLLVDGVTVTAGDRGTEDYVPRREVEIVADCPELPGYEGPRGNFLDRGTTVRLTAHVSHAAPRAREVTVRWQFIDYEGTLPLGAPVERKAQIPPGGTIHETASLTLPATGTILARLSVLSGSTVIDSSDFTLTALPYTKAAAKPDWRERFGGSFAGALGCVQRLQRLGFGWIRWRPHDHEIVIHHVFAAHAVAGGHEGVLLGPGMDQEHVGVAVLAQLEGLAGAHGNDLHPGLVLLLKIRQDILQQAGISGAGGGRQDQLPGRRRRGSRPRRDIAGR